MFLKISLSVFLFCFSLFAFAQQTRCGRAGFVENLGPKGNVISVTTKPCNKSICGRDGYFVSYDASGNGTSTTQKCGDTKADGDINELQQLEQKLTPKQKQEYLSEVGNSTSERQWRWLCRIFRDDFQCKRYNKD